MDHPKKSCSYDRGFAACALKIKQDGKWREAINSEGYMEVAPKATVLFAQTCEWPEEIDRKRAERAKEQAEEALRQSNSQAQFRSNQIMLARAMAGCAIPIAG